MKKVVHIKINKINNLKVNKVWRSRVDRGCTTIRKVHKREKMKKETKQRNP